MAKMEKNTTEKVDNSQVMEMIKELQAQNQELAKKLEEKDENPSAKAKKRYEGPRKYSFKKWNGLPVLDYTSEKRDSTRPNVYKANNGDFVNNQLLVLKLAGEKEPVKVDVNEFNMYCEFSEKIEAKRIDDGKEISYEFDTPEHGTFTVQEKIIN